MRALYILVHFIDNGSLQNNNENFDFYLERDHGVNHATVVKFQCLYLNTEVLLHIQL